MRTCCTRNCPTSRRSSKFARPYSCLTIAYLEETQLFPKIVKNYFKDSICLNIKENLFCYMDDGFIALAQNINAILLKNALNDLHPSIKFTMETGKIKSNTTESLNFLDIEVILNDGKFVSTDIFKAGRKIVLAMRIAAPKKSSIISTLAHEERTMMALELKKSNHVVLQIGWRCFQWLENREPFITPINAIRLF